MARHCREKHGAGTIYLKEKRKPRLEPWSPNWQQYIENPAPMLVKVSEDPDESYESSLVCSDDVIEMEDDGLGSLDRTMEPDQVSVDPLECHEQLRHPLPINTNLNQQVVDLIAAKYSQSKES